MKKLITPGIAIAAALALAACGGSSSSGSASGAAGSGTGSKTVSVQQLSGVGSVLVDQSGKALYSSNLEASGKIVCDDAACNAFWKPVTLAGGKPTASAGAGKLGVITRPDGQKQVTASGKPLYTFAEDSPGKATGNGFTDDFGGHHFTWNVVHAGGKTNSGGSAAAAPKTTTPSYNNGY
jgi:predicted lipoprotein with Yx(FWY)xxD motif